MGSLGGFSDILGPRVLALLAYNKCLINVHLLSLLFPYEKKGALRGSGQKFRVSQPFSSCGPFIKRASGIAVFLSSFGYCPVTFPFLLSLDNISSRSQSFSDCLRVLKQSNVHVIKSPGQSSSKLGSLFQRHVFPLWPREM